MTGTPIPGAIEVLLKKAAVDPAFRGLFLSGPLDAARSIGLDLAPAERTVLSAIPADQLERTAERMEVPEEQRRVFRGRAAAAMLAIVAGTAFLVSGGGCGSVGDNQWWTYEFILPPEGAFYGGRLMVSYGGSNTDNVTFRMMVEAVPRLQQ